MDGRTGGNYLNAQCCMRSYTTLYQIVSYWVIGALYGKTSVYVAQGLENDVVSIGS